MKRKIFSLICLALAIALAVSLVACNPDDNAKKFSVTADYDAEQGSVIICDAGENAKAEFKAGEKAYVKVTPKRGYSIDTFTVNDEAAQLENGEYSFDVEKNTVIKVTFKEIPEEFDVYAEFNAAQGSVVISDTDGIVKSHFTAGERAKITITASSGYYIYSIDLNEEVSKRYDKAYTFSVNEDTKIIVTFKEIVQAPADTLNSVKTKLKVDGSYVYQMEGGESEINNITTIFGTNAVNIYETTPDGDVNYDDVYVNVGGKIAMPYHTLKNEIEYNTSDEDFAEYDNPFKALTISDFVVTDDNNVFALVDADKRKTAATAITGYYESIASFKITVDDGKVTGIDIVTERIKRGSGASEYYYTAVYSLGVSDWGTAEVDPEKTSVYVKEDAHDVLSAALAAAYRAKNYTIKINEKALSAQDEDLEYFDYVTEQAIYYDCDVVNAEGKYIWKQGYVEIGEDSNKTVYPFDYDPETGVVTLLDPNKNFPTLRSMRASFNSTGDFAPEIFSCVENADGSITYALYPSVNTYDNVREILLSFADGLDMISLYLYYTYEVTITVKDGALYQVELLYAVSDALIYRTMTYSEFDNTEMPITFDNCVRESVLDDYAGTYTDGTVTAVIDRENGIVINGKYFEITDYDVWYGIFTGNWDGGVWGLARVNATQLVLLSDEDDVSYVLTSTAIAPVTIPSDFTGVWTREGNANTLAIAYNYVELNGVMLKVLSCDEKDGLYAMGGEYTYNFLARNLEDGTPVIWVTPFYEGFSTTSYVLHKDANAVIMPESLVGIWKTDGNEESSSGYHKAVVGLTTVSLEVRGQKPKATIVRVEKDGVWRIVLNVSGFVVGNDPEDEDNIVNDLEFVIMEHGFSADKVVLFCVDYIWGSDYSVTLVRTEDSGFQPTVPERYFGTYSGSDGNGVEYLIVISADGITVTMGGTAYTATVVEVEDDDYELITLSINGTLYYIMPNADDETAIDFIDNDDTIEVTLELVGGNVSIPNKYCGTFTGSKDGVAYAVTVTASGVTVSVDGVEKQITSIKFDATEGYITVKFDGVVYNISDMSYSDPITQIMFGLSDYSFYVVLNREA